MLRSIDVRPLLACGMALLVGFFVGRALVQQSPNFVRFMNGVNEAIVSSYPAISFAKLRR